MYKKIISVTLSLLISLLPFGQSLTFANTTSTTVPSTMNTCQFVDLLINIGAIVPNLANQARAAVGCPTYTVNTNIPNNFGFGNSSNNNNYNDDEPPTLDLKANGSSGTITIKSGESFVLSWVSNNASSCKAGNLSIPLKGSDTYSPTTSDTYSISCQNSSGDSVTQKVKVNVSSTPVSSNNPMVDVKVNGQDYSLTVPADAGPIVTWTSRDVESCMMGQATTTLSGALVLPVLTSNDAINISIVCTSQGSSFSDSVTINTTAPINPLNQPSFVSPDSLQAQAEANAGNITVSFGGKLNVIDKCWGEDDFYKVYLTPLNGNPVVGSVTGASPSQYKMGDPTATLELLYWQHGDIINPPKTEQGLTLGTSDGGQKYNCSTDASTPGNNVVKGGVIYNIGQSQDVTTVDTAQQGLVTTGLVDKTEASKQASQIKPKPSGGFLGMDTGTLVVIVAAVAFTACAVSTGGGCLVALGGVGVPGATAGTVTYLGVTASAVTASAAASAAAAAAGTYGVTKAVEMFQGQ